MQILHFLTLGIGFIGILIILWGVISSLKEFILLSLRKANEEDTLKEIGVIRRYLGSYLLLGLEFLIAADIINTIIKPTIDEVVVLGAIVAIRTVLTYSLNKEVSELQ
ncbi:MAG: DUF1622 domain-containing protein [Campylobacterota bacterium]|nr:DUF1622 domain-containing protein [Campylobacterota bacterium]